MELRQVSAAEWDDLIAAVPHLPFYSSAWLQAVATGLGAEIIHIAGFLDKEIAFLFPALLIRKAFLRLCYGGLPYGGPLFTGQALEDAFEEIAQHLRGRGIDRIRFQPFEKLDTPKLASAIDIPLIATRIRMTHRNKGSTIPDLPESLDRGIRRAVRLGLMRSDLSGEDGARAMYELYKDSMRRNRAPVKYPLNYFRALSSIVSRDFAVHFSFAMLEGRPLAGVTMLESPEGSYYLHGGFLASASSNHPMDFVFNEQLKDFWASSSGLFDFGISGVEDEGLRRYKMKWGGTEEVIPSVDLIFDRLACGLLDAGNRLASSFPSLASKLLGR